MNNNRQEKLDQQSRKKLWPWVVLLIVTFCFIYSYTRIEEFIVEYQGNLPDAIIGLFLEYFFGVIEPNAQPKLDV